MRVNVYENFFLSYDAYHESFFLNIKDIKKILNIFTCAQYFSINCFEFRHFISFYNCFSYHIERAKG